MKAVVALLRAFNKAPCLSVLKYSLDIELMPFCTIDKR